MCTLDFVSLLYKVNSYRNYAHFPIEQIGEIIWNVSKIYIFSIPYFFFFIIFGFKINEKEKLKLK